MSTKEERKQRIRDCKAQALQLKAQLEEARMVLSNGMIGTVPSPPLRPLKGVPKVRRVLEGHFGKVFAADWANDGEHLVSAAQDGKLIVWDALSNVKRYSIALRSMWVMACSFEQVESNIVASGGLDNVCTLWDLTSSTSVPKAELVGHDGYVSSVGFFNTSSLVTASGDSTLMTWDAVSGRPVSKFTSHAADVMSVSVKPGDQHVFISGGCDQCAMLWDTRAGQKSQRTFRGNMEDINGVTFLPSGHAFGTAGDDSSCRLFDIRGASELNVFVNTTIAAGASSIASSASGRVLFAGYDDYNAYGWDTLTDAEVPVFSLQRHQNRVSTLSVNAKGDGLCTGSWDFHLLVWS
jgi:guanine nucleotide-binding protein G(I)/G(S)/G(T) subunit beta-1